MRREQAPSLQDNVNIPKKFPLDKRPVWVYTYHNGICPCEIRRKRTVPPMGVVEAQRSSRPGTARAVFYGIIV